MTDSLKDCIKNKKLELEVNTSIIYESKFIIILMVILS